VIIEKINVGLVNVAKYNPRKDLQPGDAEYERLKRSVERWDLVEPLVWNKRSGNLVGGHQRLKILIARGDSDVDVSVVDLGDQDEAALNIALNKIGGEWDMPKLSDLLSELDGHGFDATFTGFDGDELENLLTWTPGDVGESEDGTGQVVRFVVFICDNNEMEFRKAGKAYIVDMVKCEDENCDIGIRKLDPNAWSERRSKLGKKTVPDSDDSDGDATECT